MGGLGWPFHGANVAMALLARSRSGQAASATVSVVKVGGEGVLISVSSSTSTFKAGGSLHDPARSKTPPPCLVVGVDMFFMNPLHHSLQLRGYCSG